ncbi:hypothetical protein N9Y92_04145, partial [Chlamydiales bacterium]|nr:hypothetical protein [Chlamydiales bacterium]
DPLIKNGGISLVIGTKSTLRNYPEIKTLYKGGWLGLVPLVFAPEIGDMESHSGLKLSFWNEVKQCLSRFS